jgi:hypothetical protein
MNEEVSTTLDASSSLLLSTRRWSSLYVNKASALLVQDWNILVNYHLDLSGHHCRPVIQLHLPLKQMAAIPNSQSYTLYTRVLVMDGNLPCDEVKAVVATMEMLLLEQVECHPLMCTLQYRRTMKNLMKSASMIQRRLRINGESVVHVYFVQDTSYIQRRQPCNLVAVHAYRQSMVSRYSKSTEEAWNHYLEKRKQLCLQKEAS